MKKISKASKSAAVKAASTNSNRYQFRNKSTDEQKAAAAKRTVETEPKGYILLKQVILEANKLSIPTHRIVVAMGGNRGAGEPLSPNWEFVYFKGSRWLPKGCLKDLPKLQHPDKSLMKTHAVGHPAKPKVAHPASPVKPTKAEKKAGVKPTPITPKDSVRDAKGKVVKKATKFPGVPVQLKKKVAKPSAEPAADEPEAKPAKSKLSTTRTTEAAAKPKTKTMKRTVNEAGIPVMQLVGEEEV